MDVKLRQATGVCIEVTTRSAAKRVVTRESYRRRAKRVVTQPRATAILLEDGLDSPGPFRADPDPAFPS